jgi:hypothetical protein
MPHDSLRQCKIIADLHVSPDFDVAPECERRIEFLVHYFASQKLATYDLGIRGRRFDDGRAT